MIRGINSANHRSQEIQSSGIDLFGHLNQDRQEATWQLVPPLPIQVPLSLEQALLHDTEAALDARYLPRTISFHHHSGELLEELSGDE